MRSIPAVMTWEMLQRGRWNLLVGLLGGNLFPALLLTALRLEGTIDREDPVQALLHLLLGQCNMFVFAAGVLGALGNPSRLYAFPVRTTSLVAWHLLPAMLLVALASIVSTTALNMVFNLNWPLWGPALFVAVALVGIQAVLWLAEKSAWMPWSVGLVGLVLGLWNKSRYGALFSQPMRMWSDVTPVEVLTLLAFAVASYYVAVFAVGRNRRGDAPLSLGALSWIDRHLNSSPAIEPTFRTPADAHYWFEWRQKGWAMPAVVIFGAVIWLTCWVLFSREPHDLFEGIIAGGLLLSIVGFVVGILMGNSGTTDASLEMGHYLATRPLTSTEMARTILKVAAKSIAISWAMWFVPYLIVNVAVPSTLLVPRPEILDDFGYWYLPVTLFGPWIVVMASASVMLTGRVSPFREIFFTFFAAFIGWTLLSKYALSHQDQLQIGRGIVIVVGTAFVSMAAWSFITARRCALIGNTTVVSALSAWLVLGLLIVVESLLQPNIYMASLCQESAPRTR